MRIFARTPFRLSDADEPQHLYRTSLRRLSAKTLMQPKGFTDLASHREDRIEAGHGLLKNHADLIAADVAHGALIELEKIDPLEANAAFDLAGRFRDQAQNRARGNGFAAAALAHDRNRLAGLYGEGDAVHGSVHPFRGAEMRLQIFNLQQSHFKAPSQPLRHARIKRIAKAVAKQIDRKHGQGEEYCWKEHNVRLDLPKGTAFRHDIAP